MNIQYLTHASNEQKQRMENLTFNFNKKGILVQNNSDYEISPFKGVFNLHDKQPYSRRIDQSNKMNVFQAVVLNEEIKNVNSRILMYAIYLGNKFANIRSRPIKHQINSIILLKYCRYKQVRTVINPIGEVNKSNMTTIVTDNIYGSDFDNFSPSVLDSQLNQQGVDMKNNNQKTRYSNYPGSVITYGSF